MILSLSRLSSCSGQPAPGIGVVLMAVDQLWFAIAGHHCLGKQQVGSPTEERSRWVIAITCSPDRFAT
ncbi:hypothetical protein [Streptomyces sp. NPDC054837]